MTTTTINPVTDKVIRFGISADGKKWRLIKSTAQAFAMFLIVQVVSNNNYKPYSMGWTDNGKYANAVFNRIIE